MAQHTLSATSSRSQCLLISANRSLDDRMAISPFTEWFVTKWFIPSLPALIIIFHGALHRDSRSPWFSTHMHGESLWTYSYSSQNSHQWFEPSHLDYVQFNRRGFLFSLSGFGITNIWRVLFGPSAGMNRTPTQGIDDCLNRMFKQVELKYSLLWSL